MTVRIGITGAGGRMGRCLVEAIGQSRADLALAAAVERPDSSLAVIADVAASLERAASEPRVHQLWWVLGGVVEALRQGGLPASASVKRLLGQVDRQVRRMIEAGEPAVAAEPPLDLLNALVYEMATRRMLFGTGFPTWDHGGMMLALRHAEVSEADRAAIAGGNLTGLLQEADL